ncbi:MAG: hypothetical protein Q4C67_08105, partial [Deinococcus sp.]|nr:hypothetical protein [Deinococcus sp.]
RPPGLLRRWRAAYARSSPLGKTVHELGLAYLGYFALLPLTLLLAVLVPVLEELIFRGIPLLLRLGLWRVLPA